MCFVLWVSSYVLPIALWLWTSTRIHNHLKPFCLTLTQGYTLQRTPPQLTPLLTISAVTIFECLICLDLCTGWLLLIPPFSNSNTFPSDLQPRPLHAPASIIHPQTMICCHLHPLPRPTWTWRALQQEVPVGLYPLIDTKMSFTLAQQRLCILRHPAIHWPII